MARVQVTKRIEFCASHRYEHPAWDAETNAAVFGSCYRPHGHGHNYLLEVTVSDRVDQQTGMVVNLTELKRVLTEVLTEFDHKHLNLDTGYFEGRIPTSENIATVIWRILAGRLPQRLERLRLYEDAHLYVDVTEARVRGGQAVVTRRYQCPAAHQLPPANVIDVQRLYGRCASATVHGHNYTISVAVEGSIDPETGMVVNLPTLDRLVDELVLARFAYQDLNRDRAFRHQVPTGENFARVIHWLLAGQVPTGTIHHVSVAETEEVAYAFVAGSIDSGLSH